METRLSLNYNVKHFIDGRSSVACNQFFHLVPSSVIFDSWSNYISEMAGPVVLVTSASGRIGKEVIARLKSLNR